MKLTHFILLLLLFPSTGCNKPPATIVKSAVDKAPDAPSTAQPPPPLIEPDVGESDNYKKAYSLLFDWEARARKAIKLLVTGKSNRELNEKDLNLLCWAYNELGESDKQLEYSRCLWERYPDGETSTHWICGSLWNKHAFTQNTSPIFEFVSKALDDSKGNSRDLLILKASTLAVAKDRDETDAERRTEVSNLLIQAYCAGPPSSGHFKNKDLRLLDSPSFIDFEDPFRDFFSSHERDALKLRMKNAKHAKSERGATRQPDAG